MLLFRCLSLIGRNHACAVQALAINLFNLDPKLDVQEHNLYDECCTSFFLLFYFVSSCV